MAKVLLGVPGTGMLSEEAAQASWLCSYRHQVDRIPSNLSGPNINNIWIAGLNAGMKRTHDYLAMICTDIAVEPPPGTRWIDILVEEMEKAAVDYLTVPVAIKDHRMLTSSGIGNPKDRWTPWRRFTTRELSYMPPTFTAEQIGYGDKFLLHNFHLCLWDLRNPRWYEVDQHGVGRFVFNLTEEVRFTDGVFSRAVESEDWAYSRLLWEAGMKTAITSRIVVHHQGSISYDNVSDWGTYKNGDEDTASQWREEPLAPLVYN